MPPSPCSLCAQLADEEYASQKYGWEEHNTHLSAVVERLTVARDLRPYGSRQLQLRRCPECGGYYLYRSDYEYLANGSEDEQFLTRLTLEQAEELLGEDA